MANGQFRVFLSAVSSEFGSARDGLAADLRARGLLVHVQSDFRQEAEADSTLSKLQLYITTCDAVVCILGRHSGSLPPAPSAAPFRHILPTEFSEASYTQWEFFFARHHGRRQSIYVAGDPYRADRPDDSGDVGLQGRFLDYVIGRHDFDRTFFANEDQLCRAVHKEHWPTSRWRSRAAPSDTDLTVIYDLFRTAYLNQKYYGHRLHQIHRSSPTSASEGAVAAHRIVPLGAAEYSELFKAYTDVSATLRAVVDEIRARRGLSNRALSSYRRARQAIVELEKKDEPNPDRALIRRCQREVIQEIPLEFLWFPVTNQRGASGREGAD